MSEVALAEETWLERLETSGALQTLQSPQGYRRQPEIIAGILEDMQKGASLSAAGRAQGFAPSTVTRWRKESPEFNTLCQEAAAKAYVSGELAVASDKDWKAKVSWLRARSKDMLNSDWHVEQSQGSSGITVNITVRQDDTPSLVDVTPKTPVLDHDQE